MSKEAHYPFASNGPVSLFIILLFSFACTACAAPEEKAPLKVQNQRDVALHRVTPKPGVHPIFINKGGF
jgi:hypothetical protein